jgi:hypothetical protein
MDYLNTILDGFVNERTNKHLDKFILREWKNAEKEYYDLEEFFDGCLDVISMFNDILDEQAHSRKSELDRMIVAFRNGNNVIYEERKKVVLSEEEVNVKIQDLLHEFEEIDRTKYNVHLSSLTKGKFIGHLYFQNIQYIEKNIRLAYIMAVKDKLGGVLKEKKSESKGMNKKPRFELPIDDFKTEEKLMGALIMSSNDTEETPIEGAYELLKELWFVMNSDSVTFDGKEVPHELRRLMISPYSAGKKPDFTDYFDAEKVPSYRRRGVHLKESHFQVDLLAWIKNKLSELSLTPERKEKYEQFEAYIKTKGDSKPKHEISNDKVQKNVNGDEGKHEISREILKSLHSIDRNIGALKAFQREKDLVSFVEILSNYFNSKKYKLPEEHFKMKRGGQTSLAKVLNEIHHSNTKKKLINDTEFIEIVESLDYFEGKSANKIYKLLIA